MDDSKVIWFVFAVSPWDVLVALCYHLIVLAHGTTWRRVLALDLLAWHPLAGVVGGGEWPGRVGSRVLPLLVRELAVWSILLPTIVRLRENTG